MRPPPQRRDCRRPAPVAKYARSPDTNPSTHNALFMHFTFPSIVRLVTLALAFSLSGISSADAKQKGSQRARAAQPTSDSPAAQLAPFIEHLDTLLALERPANPKAASRANGAGGRVAVLKREFAAKRADATPESKGQLDAAIATCDALTRALDERDRTLSQIR